MFTSLKRVTYQVPDISEARQWYSTVLDKEPVLDSPFYVMFTIGDAVLTLVPAGSGSAPDNERVVAYWGVDDIDVAYRRLLGCGATPRSEISTSLVVRIAKVVDPFGNVIGITDKPAEAKQQSVENQPSQSAMTVAFCRAVAAADERAELRGPDYLAELFLTEDSRRALKDQTSREWVIQKLATPELYGYFRARTAYLDHIFAQTLRENRPQIVFLGAGYDTRSYRFKDLIQETRIYELDIQPTQQRKRDILKQARVPIPEQVTFVPINFNTGKIEEVLLSAGFDKNKWTLFIWEGVTYYLPAEAVRETLHSVKRSSPPASMLCFDYMTAPVPSTYNAEPFQFWINPEKIGPFLGEQGYIIVEHLAPEDIQRNYLVLADGSPAGKTLPFFRFVQASVRG